MTAPPYIIWVKNVKTDHFVCRIIDSNTRVRLTAEKLVSILTC